VAYVEPSVRTDDGRYGDNPNRLQQHTQFQVILKLIRAIRRNLSRFLMYALGNQPRRAYDIPLRGRQLESPALGAWGLGWEVWLDGLEITQFTYFQQAGAQVLDPVSVELDLRAETHHHVPARCAQRVRHRLRRHSHLRRNLPAQRDRAMIYKYELANVDGLRKAYDFYESEAEAALSHEPPLVMLRTTMC